MRSAVLTRAAGDVFLSRLIWPVLALFALTLALVFATVAWTTRSANDSARERERALLSGSLSDMMADVQFRAGATGRARIEDGASGGILSGAFVISAAGDVVRHVSYDPALGYVSRTLEAQVREALLQDMNGVAAGRLVFDGTTAVAIASGSMADGRSIVAYRRITEGLLARIGRRHRLDQLSVGASPPEGGRMALAIAASAPELPPAGYFTWTADRPGDVMSSKVVPALSVGAVLAIILFAVFLVSIRGIAGQLAESQEQTEKLLGRDPLSGLSNRLLFADRLEQEICRTARTGEGLAVLFLDLDRFKDVNDTFGHQAGDALLKETARRLLVVLRGEDTLARFGGDEFAIIQTRTDTGLDAGALARRILDALTEPFVLNGTTISVGVSIGIALAPADSLDCETLMRLADTALYQAKSEGRNRYCFFAREMDETIRLRKIVEDDLRHAIKSDQLVLHYQPIYSPDGERILAVEALVRWPHPEHGMVSPAKFIAVAEERGLVIPLGEWVMRRACSDAVRWPGVRLAVNVSAIQFHHRDFVASVLRASREAGFDPTRLEIELTEGVLVDDEDAAEAAMMDLRAVGVNLALDDFGTGYSSLIYLRRFAFDKIKIDRSFLESMEATGESAILVHSIVHLGRALGLTVTAEGVETREQQRFLQALGCHQLQGFLFSRAVPASAIDAMIAAQQERDRLTAAA